MKISKQHLRPLRCKPCLLVKRKWLALAKSFSCSCPEKIPYSDPAEKYISKILAVNYLSHCSAHRSHKIAVNSFMPFNPDFYFNIDDFNSLATRQARCRLFGKTTCIEDWYCSMRNMQAFWSEYLYDFYGVNQVIDFSRMLDGTHLYWKGEKADALG